MNLDIKKSYYAVIPATVRYDNNVVPSAKLLYGEITALCNEKGYCWATNDYFSKLYSVSKRTISTWIKSLCNAGYISAELVLDNSSQKVKMRCLKVEANFDAHLMKTSIPSRKKVPAPNEENFAHKIRCKIKILCPAILTVKVTKFWYNQKSTTMELRTRKILRLIVTHICQLNFQKITLQKTIRSFPKANHNVRGGLKILT